MDEVKLKIFDFQNNCIYICVHKITGIMKIITTRDIRKETKFFFELAEKERVAVKRGKNKYVNLIVTEDPDIKFITEDWVKEFMAIPDEYRVNPFEISPSGDLFFADSRNVENLKRDVKQAEREIKEGKGALLTPELRNELFGTQ